MAIFAEKLLAKKLNEVRHVRLEQSAQLEQTGWLDLNVLESFTLWCSEICHVLE